MITVTNTGKAVAFFVHIRALHSKGGDDILPVIFDDNYLLLAPGESRIIRCSYANKDAENNVAPILYYYRMEPRCKKQYINEGGGFAEEISGN